MQPTNLEDGRVPVTGASSGIGRATAPTFTRSGATVMATTRRDDGLKQLCGEVDEGLIESVPGDLTDPQFLAELATTAGLVDILVNCAGGTDFSSIQTRANGHVSGNSTSKP